MSISRVKLALLLAVACLLTGAAAGHRDGFTLYGRVDRPDGTYREMLVETRALDAMRAGREPGEGWAILMESRLASGGITSIFAKRREAGGWEYGAFREGGTIADFDGRGPCAGCHRAAEGQGGTFTRPMLRAFMASGAVQRRSCERGGRAPCEAGVYEKP